MAFEPPHHIRAVSLGRFYADAERYGHFLAAFPFREELHDFTLAWRQASAPGIHFGGVEIALQVAVQNNLCNFGSQARLGAAKRLERTNQIAPGVGLQ